ncbi:hypothetical protein [Mycolicibacterium brumae]|uniref:hypothetical protein n=1 Tax=Mycolicibacterium brumae TaxID=85968 RepID=UPI000A5679DB|nr:hypothetical protein [Mycolicibacterium brumae]UWW09610.1 hypothetical protein L2Z93_002719 [Mycolicibacterium brumae]
MNVAGRLVSVAGVADSFASVGEELVPAFESGWESAAGYEQREWVDGAVIEEPDGFGPVLVGEPDQWNALGSDGDVELSPPLD